MRDLPVFDLNGRRELFLRPHDVVRRHLAEVAREHGVSPALVRLLLRRRLHRLDVQVCRDRVAQIELFVEVDLCLCAGRSSGRRGLVLELPRFRRDLITAEPERAYVGLALRPTHSRGAGSSSPTRNCAPGSPPRGGRRGRLDQRRSCVALALAHAGVLREGSTTGCCDWRRPDRPPR